jgi:prepilin-type N-terminal cleavage/methylation domain-containing protein
MAEQAVRIMTPTSPIRGVQRFPSAGFTLLELIIVLAILAMGAVLLIPSIGNMSSRTFTAQVREASALLNYARRNAVVTGQATSIQFFPAADSDAPAQSTAQAARSELGRSESWHARGIELAYEDSTQQRSAVEDGVTITFFPEGGSTGGALILTLDRREAVISIDPFSGKVRAEYADD